MKDKKKVLFVLYTMNVGGVEKAFLNLLSTLDSNNYEIDLILLQKKGGFLDEIPKYVNIEELTLYNKVREEVSYPIHFLAWKYLKKGKILKSLRLINLSLKNKLSKSTYPTIKNVFKNEKMRDKYYDYAISYASPFMFIDYYVINKVKAEKKICWIHFDISKSGIDIPTAKKIYKFFDQINIVSNDAKKIFDITFPEFSHKTVLRYNEINVKAILNQSNEFNPRINTPDSRIVICTVGRISHEKGQYLTIDVLDNLVKKGFDIEWWYIGSGNMIESCKKHANDLNISDRVKFFGVQKNPYPYMKSCDIYVQPSIFEGFCITLAEAKIFDKPILSTNFTGAKEQLLNYKKGNVVERKVATLTSELEMLIKNFLYRE